MFRISPLGEVIGWCGDDWYDEDGEIVLDDRAVYSYGYDGKALIDDWPSLLDPPTSSNSLELFRKHSSTGRPLGSSQFQARIESLV